jgi:Prp8 binding protein
MMLDVRMVGTNFRNIRDGVPCPAPGQIETLHPEPSDSVTGLEVSHDGTMLLSTSMDSLITLWDIRSDCPAHNRKLASFTGCIHNFEKNLLRVRWSHDDNYFAAGGADRVVKIWDVKRK